MYVRSEIELNIINEIKKMENEYSTAIIVTGEAGVGKSELIHSLVKSQKLKSYNIVRSKFSLNRIHPLGVINNIVEILIHHILTLNQHQFPYFMKKMKKELGRDQGLLNLVTPMAEEYLKIESKKTNCDYVKLKYRLRKVIFTFIKLASEQFYPLVLVIDDLQWTDDLTLGFILDIFKKLDCMTLSLLILQRPNRHDLVGKMEKIYKNNKCYGFSTYQIEPFDFKEVQMFIEDTYGTSLVNKILMSQLVYEISSGSPFYIKEVLQRLESENLLKYNTDLNKWSFSEENTLNNKIKNDIQNILTLNLMKLNFIEKSMLNYIALLNEESSYELLNKLTKKMKVNLDEILKKLELLNYIVIFLGRYDKKVKIAHNIIKEIIFNNLDSNIKRDMHKEISQVLYIESGDKYQNQRWVYHVLEAGEINNEDIDLSKKLCKIEKCIEEVKQVSDYEKALKILMFLEKRMSPEDITLKFKLELTETIYLCGETDKAFLEMNRLIEEYKEKDSQILIYRKLMDFYNYKGLCNKVVENGVKILNMLNYNINPNGIREDILETQKLFSDSNLNKIQKNHKIKNDDILFILDVLTTMLPATIIATEDLYIQIFLRIAQISIRNGNSIYAPIGYIMMSHIFNSLLKNPEKAKKLQKIALKLSKENELKYDINAMVYSLNGAFVEHWFNGYTNSEKYLKHAIRLAEFEGEKIYSAYSTIALINCKMLLGKSLSQLIQWIENIEKEKSWLIDDVTDYFRYLKEYYFRQLMFGDAESVYKEYIDRIGKNPSKIYVAKLFEMQVLYHEGLIEEAYELTLEIEKNLDFILGYIVYLEVVFFCGLTRLRMHCQLEDNEKKENVRVIERHINMLQNSINLGNSKEYKIKKELLECYYKIQVEDSKKAIEKLLKLSKKVELEESDYMAAIIHYIIADCLKIFEKTARIHLIEASKRYRKWGADYIAKLISKEVYTKNDEANIYNLDVGTLELKSEVKRKYESVFISLNKFSLVDDKEYADAFLKILVQLENWNYGEIFVENMGKLIQKSFYKNILVDCDNKKTSLKNKIINYVFRTHTIIKINKYETLNMFEDIIDDINYSILCMPIKYHNILVGVIYFEIPKDFDLRENHIDLINNLMPNLLLKQRVLAGVDFYSQLKPKLVKHDLTEREIEIIVLVAEGYSNGEIANNLNIAEGTVKNHLSSIFLKLEVDSRIKAVVIANRLNIINRID